MRKFHPHHQLVIPIQLLSFGLYLSLLSACNAIPLRINSLAKPSPEPELTEVVSTTPPEFAKESFIESAPTDPSHLKAASEVDTPYDAYTFYKSGGRQLARNVLRKLRDQIQQSPLANNWASAPWSEQQIQTQCFDASLRELIETSLPLHDLTLLFRLLGWQTSSLTDSNWLRTLQSIPKIGELSGFDVLHRLLLFEAGIRVRGGFQEQNGEQHYVIAYKIVHERDEPESWIAADNLSTLIKLQYSPENSKHLELRLQIASGPNLYENFPLTDSLTDLTQSFLQLNWDEDAGEAQFHFTYTSQGTTLQFGWNEIKSVPSIKVYWQSDPSLSASMLTLNHEGSGVCLALAEGL